MSFPQLAGSAQITAPQPVQLFAGEAPITTNRAEVSPGVKLEQYTIITLDGNDNIVIWEETNPDQLPAGILANAVDTTDPFAPATWAPYFTGGDFNHEALVWPSAIDTLSKRRAVFPLLGTIKISRVV